MRAMILAAGRGERMGQLTADQPKPLLKLANRYLIEYSLLSLASAGIQDVVINLCYQADKIKKALGNGQAYGLNIVYSEEETALETGGGVYQALPLLGDAPFMVLSADVVSDFSLANLPKEPTQLAHLVLVNNPVFHSKGDFCLKENKVLLAGEPKLTFANIGIYRPELFKDYQPGRFRLGDVLKKAASQGEVSGEFFSGQWFNIGSETELVEARSNYMP